MQLRFGDFTLDTDSRQLRRDDTERHLSPKAFEALCLLAANRPRALSKAELHERLWPSTFVSDATLTSLVAEVRTALGETARRGRFIRTIHRFGYAFRGAAEELTSRAPTAARPQCWITWEWGQVGLVEGTHVLGRATDVAIWLESPTVSRHHARIRVKTWKATIEDLGSKNGTYLRGERLKAPSAVANGDEIRLGSVAVTVRLVETPPSTATHLSAERGRAIR
jgi:DNA-binding winged helix-turn-helix (wHTH) protein